MVRPTPRRLVRAFLLGALLFLVADVSTGFAVAAGPGAPAAIVLAAPGPGDRASYKFDIPGLDESLEDLPVHVEIPLMTLTTEWLPQRLAAASDGTLQPAHPLSATLRMDYAGMNLFGIDPAETEYSAVDGHPLSQAHEWTSTFTMQSLNLGVAQTGLATARASQTGRLETFLGALGPCGFSHSKQGQPVNIGDTVVVYGGCGSDPARTAYNYTVKGWTTVDGRHALRLVANGTEAMELDLDPSLPVPLRIEARMPETLGDRVQINGVLRLKLASFEASGTPYGPPLAPRGTPQPPAGLAPLTPWMVDEGSIATAFPLSAAYAVAIDPLAYPPNDRATVPQFLADHPGAYLGYAWGGHGTDARGAPFEDWYLLWTDGFSMLAKTVTQYPDLLFAQTPVPVPGLPPWRVIGSADTSDFSNLGHQVFPAPRALPDHLARLEDAWGLAGALMDGLGYAEPNDYGFSIFCTSAPCLTSQGTLYAGRSDMAVSGLDAQLQDQTSRVTMVGVGQDGHETGILYLDIEQKAPVPILPPSTPPPGQPESAAPAKAAIWVAPAAPVAASAGLLAATAGLLYYLWPALKGTGLGLFSRIEPTQVLKQPTRAKLYAAIEAKPGLHFQALARATGLGNGALEHHLRKLEEAEVVLVKRSAGYTCYFPTGMDRRLTDASLAIRSDGSRAVLGAVAQKPGVSSRELAAHLGLSPSNVSYHLRRLQDAGLVVPAAVGAQLTDLGHRAAAA